MEAANVGVQGDDPSSAVVAVSGEVDLAVRDDLLDTLHATIHTPGVTKVVVDLSQVSFLDSTGLHVLLTARASALGSGIDFTVAGATGIVQRVLTITGVLKLLTGEMDTDPATPGP
ncbi:STAS domain-containing protein [Catellatospora sichuanensis]|uniref:STAS domain-containing protein n=1 Tax=Catellatospora sichuanensis TaxID=1969805 RepID=UPI001FEB3CF3|nr:STAS domain-containing protein [Catellatospora sichuanensis]